MNGCLQCVALDIESLVTRFYLQLKLEPWDVYARRRHEENIAANMPTREQDRQTGQTTHGLLEAIALYVARDGSHFSTRSALCPTASALALRLGVTLNQSPEAYQRHLVVYVDHYHG